MNETTSPKRALSFEKHIKPLLFWVRVIQSFFIFMCFSLLFSALYLKESLGPEGAIPLAKVAGVNLLVALFWQIFQKIFIERHLRKKVYVYSNRIELYDGPQKATLSLQDIVQVNAGLMDIVGAFSLKHSDGRVFYFSAFLNRAEYILEVLMMSRPDLEGLKTLRNSVLSSDHRLSRVYDVFCGEKKILSCITLFFLPVLVSLIVAIVQIRQVEIHFISHYTWGLLGISFSIAIILSVAHFLITEYILDRSLMKSLQKEIPDKRRNLTLEKNIFKKSYAIKFALMAVSFYLVFAFHLNQIKVHQSSWIDQRFNCLNCSFPLKESHEVAFYQDGRVLRGTVEQAQVSPSLSGEGPPQELFLIRPHAQDREFLVDKFAIIGKSIP